MPVYSDSGQSENTISYGAGVAFICCLSCVRTMLKFGGFKASLNFYNDKRKSGSRREINDFGNIASVTGAYRINRDEFFGYNYSEAPKQRITASVVPIPTSQPPEPPLRKVKSSSDLIKDKNLPPNLQQSTSEVSLDPRGAEVNEPRSSKRQVNGKNKNKQLEAQKKVEKQRLAEQKKLEKRTQAEQKKVEKQRLQQEKKEKKLALQEQAKEEKLRKEREKKEVQQAKKSKKNKAPNRPLANPLAQASTSTSTNPQGQSQAQFLTNTLDSSVSKSSGPPPYSEVPKPQKPEAESDSTGNVTYSKPIDASSWDMISKHRQQINRPTNMGPSKTVKQTMIDLNYTAEEGKNNNSDA